MRRHYVVTGEGGIKVCTPQRESVTLRRLTSTVGGLNAAVGNKSSSGRARLALPAIWDKFHVAPQDARAAMTAFLPIAAPVFAPLTGEVRLVRPETAAPAAPRRVTAPATCAPMAREGKRGKVKAWRAE